MNHRILVACLSLGLALASAPGHAFLDNIFGAKSGESQNADGGGPQPDTSASAEANRMADKALYKPVVYANAAFQGPVLVVLPGDIKSSNATFTQKFGPNNIADYAELELTRANFRVLERSDLGPILKEVQLAYGLGDPAEAAKVFKRGKFKTTKWMVKFDVLKAEPVAQAQKGFDGNAVGQLAGIFIGGQGGQAAQVVGGSVKTEESAGVWIVGLRYKILDANTTEQVAAGYVEDKMELGSKATSVLGVSEGASGGLTLDSLVQRLVQSCVAEIDSRYKKAQ
ncbi:MAG: hypothetical protein A2045_13330 [Rhodocyclales bacterium GWA2_65_20]|nr:MAG: hypothetical protein A2045_13330 [Rhodocyclales bacterium GWA2_65_20]